MDKILKKYNNIVFVDTETTGLDPLSDRIIEVGIVKIDKNGLITNYSTLINPGFKISKEVRQITGIKIKELEKSNTFELIAKDILSLLKADLFIAHNSKFDYDFLREEFKRCNISFGMPQIDTIKLAKHFYPNYLSYSLESIIDRLKFKFEKRHRGLDDAKVLFQLYNKIIVDFGEEALHRVIDKYYVPAKFKKIEDKTQSLLF